MKTIIKDEMWKLTKINKNDMDWQKEYSLGERYRHEAGHLFRSKKEALNYFREQRKDEKGSKK